jgi:hypothetical protein
VSRLRTRTTNGSNNHAEWIRNSAKISLDTYGEFVHKLNPVDFDADDWAPVTVKGKPLELDPQINPVIVEHNRLAAVVMEEKGVTVSDFYSLLVEKSGLAFGEGFHWTGPAYKILSQ